MWHHPAMRPLFLALLASLPAAASGPDLHAGVQAAFELVRDKTADPAPRLTMDPAACRPEAEGSPRLYSNAFKWGYTLPALIQRFTEIYPVPERLGRRAYWNAEKARFEMPYLAERGGPVAVPVSFVENVARHVQDAYAGGYIDAVFFPDMGHSHFLIPDKLWEERYGPIPIEDMSRMFEELFADPKLEVLYHTAEQLTTMKPDQTPVDEPRTRFRWETRNIVGKNDGARGLKILKNPESRANTVGEVPGYYWWGGGFNISANANGCFGVTTKDRVLRFDLSFFDLEPAPGTDMGDYKTLIGFGMPPAKSLKPKFGECESLRRERGR
jgi:hypothetical protein